MSEHIQEISGLAVQLLKKRLKTDADSFSPASLVRLWVEAEKLKLSEQRVLRPADDRPQVRLTQFVSSEGLPRERQIDLLREGIQQLETFGLDAGELRSALTNLVGEKETGRLLAIEAETLALEAQHSTRQGGTNDSQEAD